MLLSNWSSKVKDDSYTRQHVPSPFRHELRLLGCLISAKAVLNQIASIPSTPECLLELRRHHFGKAEVAGCSSQVQARLDVF